MPQQYTHRHSGAALVIGYAPSVRADVEAARRLRPDATLLGVKFAAVLYPEIEHVWTQHIEESNAIRAVVAPRKVYVHARKKVDQTRRIRWMQSGKEEDLDFVWPDLGWVSWSSGFAALMWARHGMGFDEVIACGIPMEPGGYCEEIAKFKPRLGDGGKSFADEHVLMRWRDGVRNDIRDGKTQGVYSMSGWTREVLGDPTLTCQYCGQHGVSYEHIENCVRRVCRRCGRFPQGHPNDFCQEYVDAAAVAPC